MASSYGFDMDTSIVSDISALDCGDFDMIIEHLLCKPTKKSKRSAKKSYRKVYAAQSVPTLNDIETYNGTNDAHYENVANGSFSATNTSCVSSLNDTCTTINSEFDQIFAYFDQDVTTNDLMISDDDEFESSNIDLSKLILHSTNERENIACNFEKMPLTDIKTKSKKKPSQRQETKDVQTKSKTILNKIQQFNGMQPINKVGKSPIVLQRQPKQQPQRNQVRPGSSFSTSSTVTLHDSDSDTTFKKPFDVVNKGNVRNKVAFFNDATATERSSSASPSTQSTSDDDEYQFRRTQSRRNFQRNCDFFENFFKDKNDPDQSVIDTSTFRIGKHEISGTQFYDGNFMKMSSNDDYEHANDENRLDPHEKLKAVRTYVQTQFFLQRIQLLVAKVSELDEKKLNLMNLKLFKKFLTRIRDCSYKCTEVLNTIGENVLTDFERNSMSAEELLYTALKEAHIAQVYTISGIFGYTILWRVEPFNVFPFANIIQEIFIFFDFQQKNYILRNETKFFF